jgi:hypothetical protein
MLNSEASSTKGKDTCHTENKADSADYIAGSLYDFCVAIQRSKSTDNIQTGWVDGEFKDGETKVDGNAKAIITKNFVAAQAGTFGPVCYDLGITWKRGLEKYLRRLGF